MVRKLNTKKKMLKRRIQTGRKKRQNKSGKLKKQRGGDDNSFILMNKRIKKNYIINARPTPPLVSPMTIKIHDITKEGNKQMVKFELSGHPMQGALSEVVNVSVVKFVKHIEENYLEIRVFREENSREIHVIDNRNA